MNECIVPLSDSDHLAIYHFRGYMTNYHTKNKQLQQNFLNLKIGQNMGNLGYQSKFIVGTERVKQDNPMV